MQQHYEMPGWVVSEHKGRALKMPLHYALQSGDPFRDGLGTAGTSL
jgi:hypothetical protein